MAENGHGSFPFAGVKFSREELESHLASTGDRDLDLRGADLSNANLDGLDLRRVIGGLQIARRDVDGGLVDIRPRDEPVASFKGASLRNVDLRGARIEGVHFEGADLLTAKLGKAQASLAHFEFSRLTRAHCDGAEFESAFFEGAILTDGKFDEANLGKARLVGANCLRSTFRSAHLMAATLAGSRMMEAHFEAAMMGAKFGAIDLSEDDTKRLTEAWTCYEAGLLPAQEQSDDAAALFAEMSERIVKAFFDSGYTRDDLEKLVPLSDRDDPTTRMLTRLGADERGAVGPASLKEAFFDSATDFRFATLGDDARGWVSVADVRWGGVNLSKLAWPCLHPLGDEQTADRLRASIRRGAHADMRIFEEGKPEDDTDYESYELLNEYMGAVRANRQLAQALRDQGLNEEAIPFAFSGRRVQRKVWWYRVGLRPWRKKLRPSLAWLASFSLNSISGYGYRIRRALASYLVTIVVFSVIYAFVWPSGGRTGSGPGHRWPGVLVLSFLAFHGRGLGNGMNLDDTITAWTAVEAVLGLIIEITFIATFTQRVFKE